MTDDKLTTEPKVSPTVVRGNCDWTSGSKDYYETDCGQSFIIIDGTPKDNGMKFCCYCGKRLRERNHERAAIFRSETRSALRRQAVLREGMAADALRAELAEAKRDAERLGWLERNHTLHTGVGILYVVDGYNVTVGDESDETVSGPFHGDTLRAAIDAAMKDTP